ncbi:hypothetical protein QVD17_41117 [Tagetes erecta]|uniref:C2H2-type domain-containing protein n=1 Tax=Tagetes erecta TaxID=13708 RepID=A0AAD8JSU7_TARER|nr:hypothetical protein QVD17_41117 [Tagetes erecta]
MNSQEEDESWEVKAFAEDAGNVTWPPRSYTCTFCRREFRSAQALGGHMNVHRRDRARLHQAQVNFKNPNLSPSPIVADNGLCFLFSLPNPNAIYKSSSLNSFNGHSSAGNLNFPAVVPPRSFSYSFFNSSINEASKLIDYKHETSVEKAKMKTDLVVEGVDLELRLGCSSSGS